MEVRNGVLCANIGENEKQKIVNILTEKYGSHNLIDFSSSSELIRTAISHLLSASLTKEELVDLAIQSKNDKNFSNFLESIKIGGKSE